MSKQTKMNLTGKRQIWSHKWLNLFLPIPFVWSKELVMDLNIGIRHFLTCEKTKVSFLTILVKAKKRSHTDTNAESFWPQMLEFFLRESRLVDPDELKNILGDGNNRTFPHLPSKKKNGFSTRTLARLAKLSTRHVEAVALGNLDILFDDIDEERFNCSRGSWLFNYAIFDTYANQPGSSLEVGASPCWTLFRCYCH